MRVIQGRNVHDILPRAIRTLHQDGIYRESRNGPVKMMPVPVTTVYEKPMERVVFWPERDANPFFHLYESLWMLAGRNDVQVLAKYAKQIMAYSNDGKTMHGAYGHRWRWDQWTAHICQFDQLAVIAKRLREDPDDRRSVLQMWHSNWDLRKKNESKDVPCNVTATFQRDWEGKLDLTVFCRSNDIIWGAYGANAVHFTMLQEYMANWIGCKVGRFYQVSVNWHAYRDKLDELIALGQKVGPAGYIPNPYEGVRRVDLTSSLDSRVRYQEIYSVRPTPIEGTIDEVDRNITTILAKADSDTMDDPYTLKAIYAVNWYVMLMAHQYYRETKPDGSHYHAALGVLLHGDQHCDWIVAGQEWMTRRLEVFQKKAVVM